MSSKKNQGFSMLELMIVLAIGFTMVGVSIMALMPVLKQDHVDQAYDLTLSVLRTYRNLAITQGNRYIITFPTNQNIQVQLWGFNQNTGVSLAPTVAYTYTLPYDIQFATQAGFPAATPDGFGNATTAIFTTFTCPITQGGNACIVFYPDGSAQDDQGQPGDYNNSLIYITRPTSNMYSSRALSVWGATGRVRGWRLYNESGSNYWVQQ